MIKKLNNPITGTNTAMKSRPPVLTDAAHTSSDAQRIVSRPPMPFENPYGAKNVAAPTSQLYNTRKSKDNVHYDEGSPANPNQKAGGYKATSHSIHNGTQTTDDMLAAVGEPRLPKGYQSIISGFPTNAPSKVGGGNQPSAKRRK